MSPEEKTIFLLELFPQLQLQTIHSIITHYTTASIEQLVDKCLTENEKLESNQSSHTALTTSEIEQKYNDSQTQETEPIEMIDLHAVSVTEEQEIR